jgi:hypothetical protein
MSRKPPASSPRRIARAWRKSHATRAYLATLLLSSMVFVTISGCNQYPEVTSPEALHLLGAIRTACSSESPVRLERVSRALEELQESEKLSPREYEAFRKIVEMAERGEWEEAEQACFQYQKSQLR